MSRRHRYIAIVLTVAALGCTAKYAQTTKAMQLRVAPSTFGTPRVHMAKSMPPQFTVAIPREMPTPGWTFAVDAIDVDVDDRRIVATITENAPEGMTAQVLTTTWLNLSVGTIDPGAYFLEVSSRREPGKKHTPAFTVLLEAK